jgi:hypothetical protein
MIPTVGRPRQTTCARGHRFTDANTRLNGNGSQECVACQRRRNRTWQRRRRVQDISRTPAETSRRREVVDDKQAPGIALVIWAARNLHATWSYHASHADAAAQAPGDGTPYTIVDINRKPWIHPLQIGKGTPMTPKELLRAQAAAIAAAAPDLTPHPGGLPGRITDAHDAGDETLATALQAAWSAEQ